MSWFSEKAREAINNSRSAESSAAPAVPPGQRSNKYYNGSAVYAPNPVTQPSTFARPSYAPGVMDQYTQQVTANGNVYDQQVTPRGLDWWTSQVQSKAHHLTPYRYPMPPPPVVQKPVTYDADDARFKPAWEVDDGNWAAVYDGVAHDSLRSMPVGSEDPVLMDSGYEAPMFRRVYADSDGKNAKNEFGKLSMFEKLAWQNAAEALGGGSRTDQSTFAIYFERAADASRTGVNGGPAVMTTAWQLLMEDINSGYLPNILPGEFDGGDSDGGGFSGGGGGFGGGGGGGAQIDLMNENDARAVVNAMAAQMLGRTVSDREFKQYYQGLLQLQKDNPQTVEYGDDGSVTVNQSIGPDGIKYNLEQQMRNTEDFVTNTVGMQGMQMLEQYMESRRLGSG